MKKFIKSADENQFELDEQAIDEISNAEEFADVEISNEDIMDAVQAIDALADAVIEKADAEEKEVDADAVLDQVTELLENTHDEEEPTEEEFAEAELPEEIANSVVRVMVSEEGEVNIEQKPDEVYEAEVDGLNTTVFDTVDDYSADLEDTADSENTGDDVLIIGNSKSSKMKKGYMTVKSSANKKAWTNAFRKVKAMIGNSKLNAAHWVIVSALAKKEENDEKIKKAIKCALIKYIKSNAEKKESFFKAIKSSVEGQETQPELAKEGQPEAETKPEQTAGTEQGVAEVNNIPEAGKPEGVEQPSGNPTEDPDKQNKHEGDVVLPEEDVVVVDVPLTNSIRKIQLKKIKSSAKGYNLYQVMSDKNLNILDGKVIKNAKGYAYAFRSTSHGLVACCAKFVSNGKGVYKPVMSGNKIVITKGVLAPVFENYEKIQLAKAIVSARRNFKNTHEKNISSAKAIASARQMPEKKTIASSTKSSLREPLQPRRPIANSRQLMSDARRQAIKSAIDAKRAERKEREAIQSRAELEKKFQAEERQRLFQSSQTQMNEEKIAIKSANARNSAALDKLYNGIF